MYTKLGEHQNVEVTRSRETRPSSETERFLTNPNSVIGSSSSGSVTVDSARRTLSLRSAWASWDIIHLERRASLPRERLSLLRRFAHPDRSWLQVELLRGRIVLLRLLLLLDGDVPHMRRVIPDNLLSDLRGLVELV